MEKNLRTASDERLNRDKKGSERNRRSRLGWNRIRSKIQAWTKLFLALDRIGSLRIARFNGLDRV